MSTDKVTIHISVCERDKESVHTMLLSQPSKKHFRITTQILRTAETKVVHLQNHLKAVDSKAILFTSPSLILPQNVCCTRESKSTSEL